MSATRGTATRHDSPQHRVEVAVVIAIVVGYVVFQRSIADRAIFVLPAIGIGLAYIAISISRGGRTLADFGIRKENLRASAVWSLAIVVTTLVAGLLVLSRTQSRIPSSFWILIAAYPVWGVAQQFLFQSVFHENLIRLGADAWSILATTLVFTAVHHPSTKLMYFSAAGGLLFSVLYWKFRNVIPLGFAHGFCGAIVHHLIPQRDPLQRFFPGIQ